MNSRSQPGPPGSGEWWATPGVPRPGAAVADVPAEVERLCHEFGQAADAAPLAGQLVALRELIERLESVFLTGAVRFDAEGGPAEHGSVSLAGWLGAACRIAPGEARARARVARALDGELPDSAEALASGQISWRHVAVILSAVNQAPSEHRAEAEAALQLPARTLDPQHLKRVGDALLHRLDADDADRRALRRLDRRGVTLAPTFEGMVAVNGLLDPVAGATVKAAIDALVLPTRKDAADFRSWAQRRADALSDICRQFLDGGAAPVAGSVRPHVSVLVDLATLRRERGVGAVDLPEVGTLTAEQARMIACDAAVSRILTDGPSRVLDVGRATRTVPAALRRAVVARDRGCIGPGCQAPPALCDAHHIVFWEDGGPTSLDNLALLCRRHHTLVHLAGHTIATEPDGSKALRLAHPPPRPHPRR